MALTAAQRAHVERRLGVCPGLRGTDLHRELAEGYGYAGSYPAFQRHLRVLRPAPLREPELRFETDPVLKRLADFAGARRAVTACIAWYNADRPHQALGYRNPFQFRAEQAQHVA
jgi:transposase InsO family protein